MILAGLSDFLTGDLTDWVIDVIDAMGYLGVAFLVALENLFPPIPSEVVLPAAGIWANDGGRGAIHTESSGPARRSSSQRRG